MKTLLIVLLLIGFNYISLASENKVCSDCSFTGTVMDAVTKKPMADVVIIAKSITLIGEQKVTTDEQGQYKIQTLPAGTYTLRFEKDNYRSVEKKNLIVKKAAAKINIELICEDDAEEDHHNWLLRADFM